VSFRLTKDVSNQTAPCTFETIRTSAEVDALAAEWDELVRGMPRPSPFLLHGWLMEWWLHYGEGARLAVVTARRDGRLVGVAPMMVRRRGSARVARFLGGHESALADLLLAEGEDESTAASLIEELQKEPFDYADLFGLPVASWIELASVGKLPVVERVEAPVLLMPDGWDAAYNAKTSSKKRNLHRRRLRQLSEIGEIEFTVGRTRAELEPMLEDAFRIHDLRWKGRPDGSTFGTGKAFHRAAVQRLGDDDVLRLILLKVGGRPAAFVYGFALADTIYLHRLAFDPALSRFSPGLVTTLETLRVAGEEGLTRCEFLGGDERYKLELADRLEPLFQGIGLGQNPYGTLAGKQRLGLINLRKNLKKNERLKRIYSRGFSGFRSSKPDTESSSG
jgi:CelD/BcsL family acetyltransferase involved in cellulose biosynthesis